MKLYFDKGIIKKYGKERVPFLYPILGEEKKENRYWSRFYDEQQIQNWMIEWKSLVSFEKNVSECDYIVYPIDFHFDYIDSLEKQCKIAKKNKKKVLVFYFGDSEWPIPNKYWNLIVFRSSLNKNNPKNEFAMPWFTADFWKLYWIDNSVRKLSIWYSWYCWYYNLKTFFVYIAIKLKILLFDNKVTYLFIRSNKWITSLWIILEKLWLIWDWLNFRDSLIYFLTAKWKWCIYRSKIINRVKEFTKIEVNIIERRKMLNVKCDSILRDEYAYNIKESLFPLVMRWNWNYSYRLSEVLSLWKIPFFIDSDCRLPFEWLIEYKNFFCWCGYWDEDMESTIIDFYKSNYNNLSKIQRDLRLIYESYFSLHWFHKSIVNFLMNNIYHL